MKKSILTLALITNILAAPSAYAENYHCHYPGFLDQSGHVTLFSLATTLSWWGCPDLIAPTPLILRDAKELCINQKSICNICVRATHYDVGPPEPTYAVYPAPCSEAPRLDQQDATIGLSSSSSKGVVTNQEPTIP